MRSLYPRISKLKVLSSAAGYYIGRIYYINEDEFEPYCRESTYMQDKETAEQSLINDSYVQYFKDY